MGYKKGEIVRCVTDSPAYVLMLQDFSGSFVDFLRVCDDRQKVMHLHMWDDCVTPILREQLCRVYVAEKYAKERNVALIDYAHFLTAMYGAKAFNLGSVYQHMCMLELYMDEGDFMGLRTFFVQQFPVAATEYSVFLRSLASYCSCMWWAENSSNRNAHAAASCTYTLDDVREMCTPVVVNGVSCPVSPVVKGSPENPVLKGEYVAGMHIDLLTFS